MAVQASVTSTIKYTVVMLGLLVLIAAPSHSQTNRINETTDAILPEVEVRRSNITSDELADEGHVLVVRSRSGEPCLLAALNATIQISYKVLEGIVHERYVSTEDIQLPEDVRAQGVCGANTSLLLLDWGNGTFHINMTFSLQAPRSPTENSTWSLTTLSVSYDLANSEVFPAASEANLRTMERSDLSLFSAQLGHTHSCQRDTDVELGSEDQGVNVKFHNVKLAAFGVTSPNFPNATDVCVKEDNSGDSEDILVPLIVACCLSAVVIFIVIAYVINRKIQRRKEQSDYRAM